MDLFDLLRCAVSLAAVFGALWFLHRRLTKGPKGGRGRLPRARSIDVVARHGLGAKAGVAVVDVDGRRYLLGVTEHAVNVLDRLGPAPVAADAAPTVALPVPLAPATRFEHELEAAELAAPAEPPTVTTVTAAVVVQQTSASGRSSVQVLPASGFPTRRAAREAAQLQAPRDAGPAEPRAETPQDEFERMLQAVVAEDAGLPQAPAEPRIAARAVARAIPAEPEPARSGSPLSGSVLHPDTWRQTVAALRRLR